MKTTVTLFISILLIVTSTDIAAKGRHVKNVNVVNTPDVNVVGIPQIDANIINPVQATITEPVEVIVNEIPSVVIDNGLTNPVPVNVLNQNAQQHIQLALFGQFNAGTEFIDDFSVFPRGYTIPNGKRFHLDLALCNTSTSSGEVTLRLITFVSTSNNVSTDLIIPIKVARIGADQTLYGNLNLPISLSASQLTDQLLLTGRRTVTTSNAIAKCMIHGRLEDSN